MEQLEREYEQKKFFKTIFRGIDFTKEKIRVYQNTDTFNKVMFFNDIDELVKYTSKSIFNVNTYFELATVNISSESGQAADLNSRYCLAFDFDKKDNLNLDAKEILLRFKQLKLHYHALVDSGNGYHAYVCINKTDNLKMVQEVQKVLCNKLGADKNAIKSTQVLRVPYTFNVKDKSNKKQVNIIKIDDRNSKEFKPYDIDFLYKLNCCSSFKTDDNNTNINFTLNKNDIPPCVENSLKKGSIKGNREFDLLNIVVYLKHKKESLEHIKIVATEWNNKNKEKLNSSRLNYLIEYDYNNCNGYMCSNCKHNKEECKSYTTSNFNLEQYGESILSLNKQVCKQCKNKKRSNSAMKNLESNEIFIYNVLNNNKDLELNVDDIINLITDRKTNKSALNIRCVRETLKTLAEKKYIEIKKGNARAGIKDTYTVNQKRIKDIDIIRVSYFTNLAVIWGRITTTELRCYLHMRYIHHQLVLEGKAQGNILTLSLDDLSKSLNDDKANVSRYVKALYDNNILDRRSIQKTTDTSQFYYQYKLNM